MLRLCRNSYLSLNELDYDLYVGDDDPGIFSCHQAVRKEWFIRAGGFNPDIVDGEWIGDNETGLNIKLRKLGGRFAYNGKAVIYHQIPSYRMTQEYLNRRLANQGNSDAYTEYRKHHYSNPQLRQRIFYNLLKALKRQFKALRFRLLYNDAWHLKQAQVHYHIHLANYYHRILTKPRHRQMILKDNWMEELYYEKNNKNMP